MALARTLVGRAARASTGSWSRSRPTSATGCPACTSSACRTPRCTRRGTGCRAAMVNSGRDVAEPADHRWRSRRRRCPSAGRGFDLALAVARARRRRVRCRPARAGRARCCSASSALDGRLRPVRGVLPAVLAARARRGRAGSWCPRPHWPRRRSCDGLDVLGAAHAGRRAGAGSARRRRTDGRPEPVAGRGRSDRGPTSRDVVGQDDARRALEIAAAGGHHLLLIGPPGIGQDDAGRAAARPAAAARRRRRRSRSPRSTRSPGGCPRTGRSPARRRSRRRTTPRRSRRWSAAGQRHGPPGRGVAGAPRGALPGRGARVRAPACWTRCGSRWSSGEVGCRAVRGLGAVPGPVPARAGRQPVPVRAPAARPRTACARRSARRRYLGAAVRAAARPGRPAGRAGAPVTGTVRESAGPTPRHGGGRVPGSLAARAARPRRAGRRTAGGATPTCPARSLRRQFALPDRVAAAPLDAGAARGRV